MGAIGTPGVRARADAIPLTRGKYWRETRSGPGTGDTSLHDHVRAIAQIYANSDLLVLPFS